MNYLKELDFLCTYNEVSNLIQVINPQISTFDKTLLSNLLTKSFLVNHLTNKEKEIVIYNTFSTDPINLDNHYNFYHHKSLIIDFYKFINEDSDNDCLLSWVMRKSNDLGYLRFECIEILEEFIFGKILYLNLITFQNWNVNNIYILNSKINKLI